MLPLEEDDISERGTYSRLIPCLRAATATPDDCFHALWEGANGTAAGADPGFSDRVLDGSKVEMVDEEGHSVREYRLFRGSVGDVGNWVSVDPATGRSTDHELPPSHLLWPADRAWFVASDVDADDTWITGRDHLIRAILADPILIAVSAKRP